MFKTFVNDFATANKEEEYSGPCEHTGPHKIANKRMTDELSDKPIRLRPKRNKHDRRSHKRANLISRNFDERMESSIEKKRAIYYKDPKGIEMIYPYGAKVAKLSSLRVIDNNTEANNFNVFVGCKKLTPEDLTFIGMKVSERQKTITPEKMLIYDASLKGMLENKPSVIRGDLQNGVSHRYVCAGYRKNPLDRDIGEYKFKPGVSETVQWEIKQGINNLVEEIEKKGIEEMKAANMRICVGYADFFRVQEKYNFPSLYEGGISTQVALSIGYCSRVHTDKDFFLTTLSVYDGQAPPEEILYHFCFPSYGIAIPMRSGDIIVFNPLVAHCATNPSRKTAMIYSCYVSNKTCNTVAAKENEEEFVSDC